jgi:hypothetical protein
VHDHGTDYKVILGEDPEHDPNYVNTTSFKHVIKVDFEPVSIDGITH